ncbi:tyrosine-protein phosphatase [Mycobacterium sp.]|uniref:tyrosine-protein phosphatase n=1 Tax=Mycobacterium sp. TaxID=1785 RepID=UPI003BA98F5A
MVVVTNWFDMRAVHRCTRLWVLVSTFVGVMMVGGGCESSGGPSSGASLEDPESSGDVVAMEGALNTRAVAGFRIADGRAISPGILYRSSALTYLTDTDLAMLDRLNIQTVIDFRGPQEQAKHPDRLPVEVNRVSSPVNQDEIDFNRIDELLDQHRFSPQMYDRRKVDSFGPFYRMFALVNSYGDPAFIPKLTAYKAMFDQLLDPTRTGALLMHCTGGRDRTGIATAILLRTLGVSEKTIEANYLASNILLQPEHDNPKSTLFYRFSFSSVFLQPTNNRQFHRVAAELGETPQHIYDAVKLRPEYLTALWATIDQKFGSFDEFLIV